jgi:peptide/nickel transport system substrate-binding protein
MARRGGSLLTVTIILMACTGGGDDGSSTALRPGSGGTLTVGMTSQVFFDMDPQYEWNFSPWELFRCCLLRTLMSYDGTSGATATEPKPDLAAASPDVSTDGSTWTFHLRPGLHYGPPLQDVQITAPDFVRAFLRAGDPDTSNYGLGATYLANIQGFTEYQNGKADSISGIEVPDPLTLVIHQVQPDATLLYDLTLATTAPIPPSPSDPSARYGVATGHDRSADPSKRDGYGRFLVSSGPYMIEGEGTVDFSLPADEQEPPSGFEPWGYDQDYQSTGYGQITLVRNPSWDPGSDPLRAALPDRIVLEGGPPGAQFRRFVAGQLDLVMDETPPPDVLHRYLDDPSLRPFVQSIDTGNLVMADFNLAQPPFDDLAVRRAVAFALDRAEMLDPISEAYPFGSTVLANHYAPDSSEELLAAGWDPFPGPEGASDIAAAQREMARSRYADRSGHCVDPACRSVSVVIHGGLDPIAKGVARSLAAVGIDGTVQVRDDFYDICNDPTSNTGMCIGDGWLPDYPSVGNLIVTNFGGPSVAGLEGPTHMGLTTARLAKIGSPVRSVPNVVPEIQACNQQIGSRGIACWTRLDQYLVTQVLPAVPLAFGRSIRISSASIGSFSWDLANQQPALDRLAVAAS